MNGAFDRAINLGGLSAANSAWPAVLTRAGRFASQYFPFTRVAMIRSPSRRLRMAPDFVSWLRYLPPAARAKAGPCFVQETRSRDVATARRGTSRFHCV